MPTPITSSACRCWRWARPKRRSTRSSAPSSSTRRPRAITPISAKSFARPASSMRPRRRWRQAIKLDPKNAQALNNLGIINYERRKFDEAIKYYRARIAAQPAMAEAHNNLGNALRMTGDVDGAMQAYQEALTHRAVYPEAYNNLGTLLQQDQQARGSRACAAQGDPAKPALCRGAQQSRAALFGAEEGNRGAAHPRRRAEVRAQERPDPVDHGARSRCAATTSAGRTGDRGSRSRKSRTMPRR